MERWLSWLKALAWKAGKRDERFEGSNPSLSAIRKFSVLDGEVAVPCNLQAAVAGLNSQSRRLYFGVCPE
jgi:hypothetical protein